MLIIRGNAPAQLRTRADQFVRAVAVHNATVQTAVNDAHIRLMVLVDTVESESDSEDNDRDQNTRVGWVQPDTEITITMEIAPNGGGLYDGLLHELILHVVPAVRKHTLAIGRHGIPVYAVGDAQISAEEIQEHGDQAAWQTMGDLGATLGIAGLLDAVIMDTCAHSKPFARNVVASLRQRQLITQAVAQELLTEINS
ncbi:hypothetical protein [Streptomyces sp. NPDC090025]|uniref:hypothetical protein n=1 Tax=Streptomyces sp. NPDC090025 TaxID=3365922 RepID=UPI003838B8A2